LNGKEMSADQYYVRIRGRVNGPFDLAGLQRLAARGVVSRVHEISADKINWTSACEYEDLFPSTSGSRAGATVAEQPEDDGSYDIDPPPLPAPAPQYAPSRPVAAPYVAPAAQGFPNAGYPSGATYQPIGYTSAGVPAGKSYSGMATASLVLSLVGLILFGFILGVLAVVFASVALSGMGRYGNPDGKGRAIAGLVLGIIDTVAGTLLLMYFMGEMH
jgi:hypothetical protein